MPPCPKTLFYELMDFTFELCKLFNVIPFDVLKQDKDEVIMLINYMAEKSENVAAAAPAPAAKNDAARVWVNDKTATGGWW